MSTLEQVRLGLGDFWESLREGWNQIARRATSAITRFKPDRQLEKSQEREIGVRNAEWGLLASEVFDGEDEIIVQMEVPGMAREDFDIEVTEDILSVRGEKKLFREESRGAYRIAECAYGHFERAIPLPDRVVSDKTKASYKNGVLRIVMPKLEKRRRKRKPVPIR